MLRFGFSGRFQLLDFNLFKINILIFCVSFSLGYIEYLCLLFLEATFPSFFSLSSFVQNVFYLFYLLPKEP